MLLVCMTSGYFLIKSPRIRSGASIISGGVRVIIGVHPVNGLADRRHRNGAVLVLMRPNRSLGGFCFRYLRMSPKGSITSARTANRPRGVLSIAASWVQGCAGPVWGLPLSSAQLPPPPNQPRVHWPPVGLPSGHARLIGVVVSASAGTKASCRQWPGSSGKDLGEAREQRAYPSRYSTSRTHCQGNLTSYIVVLL